MESCKTCEFLKELIMWERDEEGRYLPNYEKPLQCCVMFVMIDEDRVFGYTEPVGDGSMCEMYTPRKEQEHE